MRFVLLLGVAFWSTIAFVGIRKAFEQGGNALTEKMGDIHRQHPGALLPAGVVGLLAGTGLVIVEIVRIGQMAGSIGGFASLGFISAIVGAACLSSHLALTAEESSQV